MRFYFVDVCSLGTLYFGLVMTHEHEQVMLPGLHDFVRSQFGNNYFHFVFV